MKVVFDISSEINSAVDIHVLNQENLQTVGYLNNHLLHEKDCWLFSPSGDKPHIEFKNDAKTDVAVAMRCIKATFQVRGDH